MKKTLSVLIVIFLSGCGSKQELVGEIPISEHSVNDVIRLVDGWGDSPVLVEYVAFSQTHYYSPVSGYLKVRGNSGDIDYSPYLESIAHVCLSEEFSEIENVKNAYHILTELIAGEIESGRKRMYLRIKNGSVKIYNER